MPITASDIVFRLSGGVNNTAQNASLGDAKSASAATASLFDDVSGPESTAGATDYRCVYVHNNHDTLTLQAPKVFIAVNTPNTGTAVSIGVGTSALNGAESLIANELVAPTGVTFSAPSVVGTGLALGDIPPGQHRAVWIKRVVNQNTSASSDGFTLSVTGNTYN